MSFQAYLEHIEAKTEKKTAVRLVGPDRNS